MRGFAIAAALLVVTSSCARANEIDDACDPIDPVLAGSSFVVVVEPAPGARTRSPLRVRGCSRTFESNVLWRLHARDGRVLASGHTSGGGVGGAAGFSFAIPFSVATAQIGHLEVIEPDPSDGEGFPPGRAVVPVILLPDP